ncbi:Sdh_cyt domain-containing protein [Cephalotus follicularis]|uniref:Sdh_cyt domain-containing protein n=1 Tax=Cephalotus follicularis TaxID=3775 RepID=A0A1Q3CZC3_CEPFO|nr:Sdh_cyt domain-containing protein [Cephalotus follicularis]
MALAQALARSLNSATTQAQRHQRHSLLLLRLFSTSSLPNPNPTPTLNSVIEEVTKKKIHNVSRQMNFGFASYFTAATSQPLSNTVRSISSSYFTTIRSIYSTSTIRSPAFLRPLSPHLTIYKPQLSSTTSILNRFSACILSGVAFGFCFIYLTLGSTCLSFNGFYQFLFYFSKLNMPILEVSALAMVYHLFAGIGHLVADYGKSKVAGGFLLALALGSSIAYSLSSDSGSQMGKSFPASLLVRPDTIGGGEAMMYELFTEVTALAIAYHVCTGTRNIVADYGKLKVAAGFVWPLALCFLMAFLLPSGSGSNFTTMESLPASLLMRPDSDVDHGKKNSGA